MEGKKLGLLFDLEDFAAFIVSALRAGAMRHFLFVTVRALGKRMLRERVVRAPCRGALLGMSAFRIWHFISSQFPVLGSQLTLLSVKIVSENWDLRTENCY
jgi:hypothetical protein